MTPGERAAHYANGLSQRYHGAPVYLVGGALEQADPRDVDLVVVLPDELFWRAYAYPEHDIDWLLARWDSICAGERLGMSEEQARIWRRWARDCVKQARWLTVAIGGPIVDFKTQPQSWAEQKYPTAPRRLLSTEFA